jgi:hypothetical protein
MIECTPRGICSWNFDLKGEGHRVSSQIDWIGENGRLIIDGELHSIAKKGIFTGRWTVESAAGFSLTAQKTSILRKRIEITGLFGKAWLAPESALAGRNMRLKGAGVNCTIHPVHPFTRRSIIAGRWDDFRLVAFGFWLTSIIWSREGKRSV